MSAPDTLDDNELVRRWREGNAAAGASLIRRHHASVARFFMRKLGPDTEDLVQATFLALAEGLARFREDASFRPFLFGIARNKLLKHLRDHGRAAARIDPAVTSIAALEVSAGSRLVASEQSRLLLAALCQLPIDTQVMLELHYWEQMPVADIARVLELPVNTVKTRMRRGRLRLDEHMQTLAESPTELETTLRGLDEWATRLRNAVGDTSDPHG